MNTPRNRRRFLTAAVESVAGVALSGWAATLQAAAGQPVAGADGFTVIDAHTHFYDPTRPEGVPWPPRDERMLYRRVLPKDYLALPMPQPVTGTVVVEASPWVEDNRWVLDLAALSPAAFRRAQNKRRLPLSPASRASVTATVQA
jgi:hypothetical protein